MFERLVESQQRASIRLENFVHPSCLRRAQTELLGKVFVVPPASGWAELQPSAHGASQSVGRSGRRRPMHVVSLAWRRRSAVAVLSQRAWLRGKQEQRTEEDSLHSEFLALVIQSWPHRQSFKLRH